MKYEVFDAHCDTLCLLRDGGQSVLKNDFHVDCERMKAYNKYTQVFACWIEPVYKSCALKRCMELIDTFYEQNIYGILSIEDAVMIESLLILRNLKRLGVRIIALTWNYKNQLACGVLDEGGVSDFGKSVIEEMNRLGIFLDVSHLNDQSFYEATAISNLPILATHSNSRAVCQNPRNLTDDMFEIIKKSGGVAGINLYPPFLGESASVDTVICHIEHFMSLGGEDNIGIGADFDGVSGYLPEGISGCEDLYKIFDRLLSLNYSEEQVEKISHKNFCRLFEERN